jgi:hypothetical protein
MFFSFLEEQVNQRNEEEDPDLQMQDDAEFRPSGGVVRQVQIKLIFQVLFCFFSFCAVLLKRKVLLFEQTLSCFEE